MTREEAISRLKEGAPFSELYIRAWEEALEMAIKALEQESKTEWVPVGERLPENFQRVLVTLVNYNGDKVVRVAEYIGKQRIFQIKENRDIWEVGEKGLLAWRPLPEPYKAESEE